jgi:hypothetical protein
MNTIAQICNKFNVKPTDIAKKKWGSIREYTYTEILERLLDGEGNLTKDFPEFSKDTTAALLKKIFPGKTRISQPWRAYLLESIQSKRCSKCGEIKQHEEFSANAKEPDGLRAYCRVCSGEVWKAHYNTDPEKHRERTREYYRANKQLRKEYNQAYRITNPEIYAAHGVKRRTRELNALANWADHEEINIIYAQCPAGYHVDHIIPLQGKLVSGLHVENNLQYLPASENMSKSNKFDIDSYVHNPEYVPPYGKRP